MEVAIRALSPGVNDPFTALECIDQLTAGAVSLARRHDPLPYAFDSDGVLRLLFPTVGFESFVRRVFARLRPHAGRDRMAALGSWVLSSGFLLRRPRLIAAWS